MKFWLIFRANSRYFLALCAAMNSLGFKASSDASFNCMLILIKCILGKWIAILLLLTVFRTTVHFLFILSSCHSDAIIFICTLLMEVSKCNYYCDCFLSVY